MYLWRCSIAATLGLIWYFSDSVRFIIQLVVCLVCLLIPTHDFRKNAHETSTQTDELPAETPCQEVTEEYFHCFDELDTINVKQELSQEAHYPNVKRSLQQVFECAYSQLILNWYNVPEPKDSQPLHGALAREFDLLVERVIERTRDFNVCAAGVSCVRILTQHLRNAKQSDKGQLFSSRAEEMAVLRVYSEVLVRNLFPDSLVSLDLTRCALNEIVALKALELLVNWLSDPDNLNQLVVSQLDSMTLQSLQSLQSSMDELRELKREATPSSLESEDIPL
ncbi:sorting nexin-25 [Megalops cyprinoides]|uniref:sorting nexin-25 n=1 Tax=Megalops cyprinoides TaxID=118141 RepID=UPI0018649EA7|nr:sorting nexin-25 [Megalops cyprinoides]